MQRLIILLFYLCTFMPLCANCVKSRLLGAAKGDYIVTLQNKTYSLMLVHQTGQNTLILEELSAPEHNIETNIDWKKWVQEGAPGHSSWLIYEIDLKNNRLNECYNFAARTFIQSADSESLLTRLLMQTTAFLPGKERRKIGPPPKRGNASDTRAVWKPPLIFEGKAKPAAKFEVHRLHWPADGSQLAEKTLDIYFEKHSTFPFPYWIQINTGHFNVMLKVVDSGSLLNSPQRNLPRRAPEFIGCIKNTKAHLTLCWKAAPYHKIFKLYAIDVTDGNKTILPIEGEIKRENELFLLKIKKDGLSRLLKPGRKYVWHVSSPEYKNVFAQSFTPFIWHED